METEQTERGFIEEEIPRGGLHPTERADDDLTPDGGTLSAFIHSPLDDSSR